MSALFPFGLSGHEIYQQVTGGPGTGSYDAGHEAARLEAQLEEQRAEQIRRLADDIGQGWHGPAAAGAVGVAGPLADSAQARAAKLESAFLLLDGQSQMFSRTKNSVVPVPPQPPESNVINDLVPWETDLDRQITAYQNEARHNIDMYSRYDEHSLTSEQQVPRDYPSNSEWAGNISVSESGSSPGDGPRGSGPSSPQPGSAWPNGGPNAGGGPDSASGPNAVSAPPRPAEVDQQPQDTEPSDAGPPADPPPGARPPVVGPPPMNQPPPGLVPGPNGLPVGNVPPGGRGPGLGSDGGRGGGSGGGPGARGGPLGEPGAGGRPGAGAAGARGTGGVGGFAPLGAGRAGGDEDYEHQRKYTIEPDPDATFGPDEVTAPPVIGLAEQE